MKNKISPLKIFFWILGILMITLVLFFASAFWGNPISAALADKAIKEYVTKNYASLDLEIGKARYNFKFNEYWAIAQSKTSQDTHFNVYYRQGQVRRDDYESNVLEKHNTLRRLEEEYGEFVIPILAQVPGLKNNRALVQIEKWEFEKANPLITLDMEFRKDLPIDMRITLRSDLTDISLENLAKILKSAHHILLEEGCKFIFYDMFSEYNGRLVMISDVTPGDIEGSNLSELLTEARDFRDQEMEGPEPRIRVFIKDIQNEE